MLLSVLALTPLAFADPVEFQTDSSGSTVPLDRPEIEAPIINGDDATVDTYPMTGASLIDAKWDSGFGNIDLRMFVCSSTLIAPDVVLLAAHCIDESALTQGFGELDDVKMYWTRQADLSDYDGQNPYAEFPEDAVEAWDWVFHDEWDLNALEMGLAENHDVALLFLNEPLDIPHAYLPTAEEAVQIVEGASVDVVGWGQQVATDFGEQPPSGTYAIKQWGTSFINEINDFEFQVGAEEDDVRKCHGDSGGPTFMDIVSESTEPKRIIGVTSHAYDMTDCNEKGGVDTRVDHYLDWIAAEMQSRCDDGSRAWCDETGIPALPMPGRGAGRACGCSTGGPETLLALPSLVAGFLALRRRRGKG